MNLFIGLHKKRRINKKRQSYLIDTHDEKYDWSKNGYYSYIHVYVASKIIKPCICPKCLKRPPTDLHNIDGKYTKKLSTWIYLCRSCHSKVHKSKKHIKQYYNLLKLS